MAEATKRTDGILILEVRARRGARVVAVRGLLTKLVVGATDGASPLFARRIAIDGRDQAPFEFRVPVPAGEYGTLTLGLAELVLTTVEGHEERVALTRLESTFAVALKISPETPGRAILTLYLDGLRRAKAPGDVLAPAVAPPIDEMAHEQVFEAPMSEAATLCLPLAARDFGPRLPAGATRILLRAPHLGDPRAGLKVA
ncbi:MAG TPA: hypothetical protein VN851_20730 [Thermoanaerobaculia bacterium]|nr:hypothetical protein [Thermoanaerobaculia bacterium]